MTGQTPARTRLRRDPETTRALLIDALLALVDETGQAPTGRQIAERAGASERTVFVHFADRSALYEEAARRQAERWRALAGPVPPGLPLERRLELWLEQRARMYELMTPVRTLGLGLEADHPGLHRVMKEGDAWFRSDAAEVFAPELGRAAGAREPGGLLDALDAAASWAAWNHLRRRRGLSRPRARAALALTLRALLAA